MKVGVKGKQVEVGKSLREQAIRRLRAGIGKYFEQAIEAQVILSREAHRYATSILVHAGAGIALQSHAEHDDLQASFETAAEKIEKQLRRYKRRLINRHKGHNAHSRSGAAPRHSGPATATPEGD